jgi:uncharacterized protein YyaL (SSP411 family)/aryl-alcohol dehydrogenase-like predicted oxidoreductase
MSENARRKNRLAGETSPYLLQHAENPVDWYPWGPEALDRAKAEHRPILLSVGYAACHWCHVMERESFENDAIAALMNEHFVCIKVDREERPDIDEIYMAATVAMSGHGGWPMTVFLTPDRRPFFAGTYFPPTDQFGRPGFGSLLQRIAELWRDQRGDLEEEAQALTERLRGQARPSQPTNVAARAVTEAAESLVSAYDPPHGGFGPAPKFPPCPQLSLLLREYDRARDDRLLAAATGTLDGMKSGGMYDHLGGGFARYSTDDRWLVPHFEKMLYDNAQLSRVYLEAWQLTGNDEYARVARETLDYVVREMQSETGGYFSATDADSEGEEGKYFVWTPESVDRELDEDDAEAFCAYYDVTPQGNWEGVSVLNTPRPAAEVARDLGVDEATLRERLARARGALLSARGERVPPLLDDKVITSWNGLMIGAMAEGHRVLGDDRYLASAERAAAFVLGSMRRPDGGLLRTARAGRAHLDAVLEDYAYLVDALVDLYEAGGRPGGLRDAEALADRMIADFSDPDGGAFFHTAKGHEALLVRLREGHDGALPNPNAVAARALSRLGRHLGRGDFIDAALGALRAYGQDMERLPRAFCTSLGVVDGLVEPPVELVLAGDATDPAYRALAAEVGRTFLPNRLVAHARGGDELPLTAGKGPVGGKAALYVCRDFTCDAPVTSPEAARDTLTRSREAARKDRHDALPVRRLSGHATTEGTRRLAERHGGADGAAYGPLGTTGLVVSRVGFGGYRIHERSDAQRDALRLALESGVNVIDTAGTYSDGRSEQLVGSVLAELAQSGTVARDEVVVVTKVGYATAEQLEAAAERLGDDVALESVEVDDAVRSCIAPAWIETSLGQSLARLGLETVDVCLLHDPEELLTRAASDKRPLTVARDELSRRLERAFRHLEQEVARGRIRSYGVSSNTVGAPATSPEAVDLDQLLAAARAAGGSEHHFRVLELPMNLLEPEALLEPSAAGGSTSTLSLADDAGIAVLANRPLNAVVAGRLVRLATPPVLSEGEDLATAATRVATLEKEFGEKLAPLLRDPDGNTVDPKQLLDWSRELTEAAARIDGFEAWRDAESRMVAPRISRTVASLDAAFRQGGVDVWPRFRAHYLSAIQSLTRAVARRAADRSRARLSPIERALDAQLPSTLQPTPLSRKAVAVVASAPGVSVVLLGMRREEYVRDALEAIRRPDRVDARRVLEELEPLRRQLGS